MNYEVYNSTLQFFRKQIGYRATNAVKEKELYELGRDLTVLDWSKIRTKEYWEKYDSLSGRLSRLILTINSVKNYNNKSKW